MRRIAVLLATLGTLAACSYAPAERQSTLPPASPGVAGAPAPGLEARARRDAAGAINVIGTPFYALFKATACVASVVVAAPAAGVIALTDRPDKYQMRRQLDRGVGENCGGSYVLRS